jgi:hypothetical protein
MRKLSECHRKAAEFFPGMKDPAERRPSPFAKRALLACPLMLLFPPQRLLSILRSSFGFSNIRVFNSVGNAVTDCGSPDFDFLNVANKLWQYKSRSRSSEHGKSYFPNSVSAIQVALTVCSCFQGSFESHQPLGTPFHPFSRHVQTSSRADKTPTKNSPCTTFSINESWDFKGRVFASPSSPSNRIRMGKHTVVHNGIT